MCVCACVWKRVCVWGARVSVCVNFPPFEVENIEFTDADLSKDEIGGVVRWNQPLPTATASMLSKVHHYMLFASGSDVSSRSSVVRS